MEKKLLRETQIQVDTAEGGEEALKLTMEKSYDVILMDHLMPKMDGIECFRRIRNQTEGRCADTPVIMLSANAEGENADLYAEAGFDDHLMKPVSGAALEEVLLKHLPKDKLEGSEAEDVT